LFLEARWLVFYSAQWDRIEKRLHDLREMLARPSDPADAREQIEADGSYDHCSEAWFLKLDSTVEEIEDRAARGEKAKKGQAQARERMLANAAANAWDASPVSSSRLSAEIWQQIKNENWALVSRDSSISNWPHRLWNFDQHHQFIGGPGGAGIGYGLPAAVGASFAHREIDKRLCVNIQNDGDSMYAPGALWTAAHHKVPMLTIMWNNRAYHQEIMHLQRMANWRQRDVSTAYVGTTIREPYIQYAKLAESLGHVGIGPISDPKDLAVAIKRGVDAVKMGEPVLIDVVTQPR